MQNSSNQTQVVLSVCTHCNTNVSNFIPNHEIRRNNTSTYFNNNSYNSNIISNNYHNNIDLPNPIYIHKQNTKNSNKNLKVNNNNNNKNNNNNNNTNNNNNNINNNNSDNNNNKNNNTNNDNINSNKIDNNNINNNNTNNKNISFVLTFHDHIIINNVIENVKTKSNNTTSNSNNRRKTDSFNISKKNNKKKKYNEKLREPFNFDDIKNLPDKTEWLESIKEEFQNMKSLQVFESVKKIPEGANVTASRWIFKFKRNSTDEIIKIKSRLVAKGYTQQEGIDFHETFSPTLKLDSIRIFTALAVQNNFQIHQIDINAAYLNAPLKEEIYMKPPKGHEDYNKKY